MKEIHELILPDDVRYAEDHEWARPEGDQVKIGISDYAQDQLGDITFVELPELGASFKKGERFGTLESAKALSELFTPVSGEIVAVNKLLEESPELVNKDPYGDGWIIAVRPDDLAELEALMTGDTYRQTLQG